MFYASGYFAVIGVPILEEIDSNGVHRSVIKLESGLPNSV